MINTFKKPKFGFLKSGFWIHSANALLFVLALCLNLFFFNRYNVFSPEALLFMGGFWAIILLAGLPFALFRVLWVYYLFFLLLFLDLAFGAYAFFLKTTDFILPLFKIPSTLVLNILRLLIFPGAFLGWVHFVFRKSMAKVYFRILLALVLSTFLKYAFFPAPALTENRVISNAAPESDLPNVLILLLDEHMGLEFLPGEEGRLQRERLAKIYLENGFDVYGGAYSQYPETFPSVLSVHNNRVFTDSETFDAFKLKHSRLFQAFAKKAYTIHVYAPGGLGFCDGTSVFECLQYRVNSLGYISGNNQIPVLDKIKVILGYFLAAHKSESIQRNIRLLAERLGIKIKNEQLFAFVFPQVLERLERSLQGDYSGHVFYAHLLAPHAPYVYNSSCEVRQTDDWLPHSADDVRDSNTDEDIHRKYQLYFEQMLCVHNHILNIFDFLKRRNRFENWEIIIFGDHGSRITRKSALVKNIYSQDSNWRQSSFSAFLAVKKAGRNQSLKGSYFADSVSLTETIGGVFGLEPESSREDLRKIYIPTGREGRQDFVSENYP